MSTEAPQEHILELSSEQLRVQIALPGILYRGSRYDWTSFITQVTLDGQHTFCGVESEIAGEGDGGVGLCGEFGIFTPIGFEDASPGEKFPKLGIGLLTRPDSKDYLFNRPYAIEPATIQTSHTDTSVRFVVESELCRGFAAHLEKTIRVENDQLIIESHLTNIGAQPITTEEYTHNFLLFDGIPIGPNYHLSVPPAILEHLLSDQNSKHKTFWVPDDATAMHPSATPQAPVYLRAAQTEPNLPVLTPTGASWEIRESTTGLSVQETTDFAWQNFAVYTTSLTLCPEAFIRIDLAPGQSQTWSRRCTFSKK